MKKIAYIITIILCASCMTACNYNARKPRTITGIVDETRHIAKRDTSVYDPVVQVYRKRTIPEQWWVHFEHGKWVQVDDDTFFEIEDEECHGEKITLRQVYGETNVYE